VIEERNVENSIYEVPVGLAEQGVDSIILDTLGLPPRRLDLKEWNGMLSKAINPSGGVVRIAVVGKYMSLRDSYKSIFEALKHGAIANDVQLSVIGVEAEELQDGNTTLLRDVHGILVPGGFGHRGIEGKLEAVSLARENDIPYFGICLGMQCAVIETARNLLGLKDANSIEFDPGTDHPVITLMNEQKTIVQMGGTMRLGAYPCELAGGSRSALAYGCTSVSERHRHRFELNNEYREDMEKAGILFTGLSPDGSLVEIIERRDHPWFLACQFHPEFRSRPMEPHPLFSAFIAAAAGLAL
jgi:CTP synthase